MIKLKKIPYYLVLSLLTVGASLILGFLSFGGMYALMPFLSLAYAAFTLSVIYDGEIYLQNIKGAFKKLFKSNYLEHYLAKEYLLKHFPKTQDEKCPQFFKDYEKQLKLLGKFHHPSLDEKSQKQKKRIEQTLGDMEKWFALQFFRTEENLNPSDYEKELREWLISSKEKERQKQCRALLTERPLLFKLVKAFSLLSASFMALGSTYLIVEAFSVIPWTAALSFAFWPIIIVPMALIAGVAFGMLTYNAIVNLINNDTINKWYQKIRADWKDGKRLMPFLAVSLSLLAVALTLCTAGTWWTIATSARPLFEWMKKMPSFIMGIINPIIVGASALFFNIQNTAESLNMLEEVAEHKKTPVQRLTRAFEKGYAHLRATENNWQIFNPFRFILKITVTPLRIVFFLGHLVSMALTADRVPKIPEIASALVAIISEGFEDAHYFFGHQHQHGTEALLKERLSAEAGHNHNVDIPTWLLKTIASPLYALAALWDWGWSQKNDPGVKHPGVLTWKKAWNKQRGIKTVTLPQEEKCYPTEEWEVEQSIFLIEKQEKHLDKCAVNLKLAEDKKSELHQLKTQIKAKDASLKDILTKEKTKENSFYNQHRLFPLYPNKDTATQVFINKLPKRVLRVI